MNLKLQGICLVGRAHARDLGVHTPGPDISN